MSYDRRFSPMYARYAIHWFAAALCTLGAALAEDVKQVSPVEAMNAIVSKENPTYPPIARQMKMEGVVEVKVTISETGKVEESDTVSGNPILAKAAVEAVRHWKFKPFKDDGKTIKVVTNLSVTFKL